MMVTTESAESIAVHMVRKAATGLSPMASSAIDETTMATTNASTGAARA